MIQIDVPPHHGNLAKQCPPFGSARRPDHPGGQVVADPCGGVGRLASGWGFRDDCVLRSILIAGGLTTGSLGLLLRRRRGGRRFGRFGWDGGGLHFDGGGGHRVLDSDLGSDFEGTGDFGLA